MKAAAYRPDIDGLRAIAVIAVVFYHFAIPPFQGGFVGVDVFFVISGYLITGILTKDLANGTFRLGDFYIRRARRLGPALIVTVAASFAVSALLLIPPDLVRASGAAISALLCVSNILFWQESGYFDATALTKPLLHTWSLAVEFQFYLLWPIALSVWARLVGRSLLPLIVGLGLASLVGCLVAMSRDQSAAFFLSPFRAWEFAAGAIVAAFAHRRPGQRLGDVLTGAGLLAILVPMLAYDTSTPFPGLHAMPPVIGTVLVIWAAPSSRFLPLLAARPLVSIGLVSYALYLVHWPVIVLYGYAAGSELQPLETLVALAITAVLTLVLYSGVERPFRQERRYGHLRFSAVFALLALLVVAPAAHAWQSGGWLWRVPETLRSLNDIDLKAEADYVWRNVTQRSAVDDFVTQKPKLLVVGDSQAADLTNLLLAAGLEDRFEIVTRIVWNECGTAYISPEQANRLWRQTNPKTMRDRTWEATCRAQMDRAIGTPAIRHADAVVIAFLWPGFAIPFIPDAVDAFRVRPDLRIYLAGVKTFDRPPAQIATQYGRLTGLERHMASRLGRNVAKVNETLVAIPDTTFLNVLGAICPTDTECRAMNEAGKSLYSDANHLTQAGVSAIAADGALGSVLTPLLGQFEHSPGFGGS